MSSIGEAVAKAIFLIIILGSLGIGAVLGFLVGLWF